MSFNPVREGGLEKGYTYDEDGKVISGKVVWAQDATLDEMHEMFEKGWADFAVVENNSGRVLLVTDEPIDGEQYCYKLVRDGITNWHYYHYSTRHGDLLGEEIVRHEPDEIIDYVKKMQSLGYTAF